MDIFDEGISTIDGMETPIHCVYLSFDKKSILAETHYHKYIEVIYCIDCKMNAMVGSTNYYLKSGDLLIIGSGLVHSIYSIAPHNEYYVLRFSPDMLYAGASQQAFGSIYVKPLIKDSEDYKLHFTASELAGSKIPTIIKDIMDVWDNHAYAWEVIIHEKLLGFFIKLLDFWQVNVTDSEKENQVFSDNLKKALNFSMRYIQLHYNTVTANEVAEKCSFNYSYFLNMFKKYTGTNFNEYIMNIKIQNAANLLLTTSMSVTEIAFSTGFSSSSHFISEFKKQKMLTPLKYRQLSAKATDTAHTDIPSHNGRFK